MSDSGTPSRARVTSVVPRTRLVAHGHVEAGEVNRPRVDPGMAAADERGDFPVEELHELVPGVAALGVRDAVEGSDDEFTLVVTIGLHRDALG
jgi:hypothetical protein